MPPRSFRRHRPIALAAFALVFLAAPASALQIDFDTSYDFSGFFDPANNPGALETLDQAAAAFESFTDSLDAITPGGGNSWTARVVNPGGLGRIDMADFAVAADTVTIFIGARPLFGALGFASPGESRDVVGDAAWVDTVAARGQAGALDPTPTDFGPWGGSITFNSSVNWSFDPAGPSPTEQDFLTTLTHEVAHLLGFGGSASFSVLSVDDDLEPDTPLVFTGADSVATFGDVVTLGPFGGHWAEGTVSTVDGVVQETLMDPSTPQGERQLLTDLDYAALSDIGWEVQVPEPALGVLVAVGLAGIARRERRA